MKTGLQKLKWHGGIIISALALLMIATSPGQAQFSDTWEFFNALEEVDYLEMRTRLTRGANINSRNEDGLSAADRGVEAGGGVAGAAGHGRRNRVGGVAGAS